MPTFTRDSCHAQSSRTMAPKDIALSLSSWTQSTFPLSVLISLSLLLQVDYGTVCYSLFFLTNWSYLFYSYICCLLSLQIQCEAWCLTLRPQIDYAVPAPPLYQHLILRSRKRKIHSPCPLSNEGDCSFAARMKTIKQTFFLEGLNLSCHFLAAQIILEKHP